ncbi:hypothetical protein GLA29479_1246 [Lysobacter antibioticus]|nr:hypothetical protein GLA29479_1246 [Lysobacter antibioticus]
MRLPSRGRASWRRTPADTSHPPGHRQESTLVDALRRLALIFGVTIKL